MSDEARLESANISQLHSINLSSELFEARLQPV